MSELVTVASADIERLVAHVRAASSLEDLQEARARVEALRAWAKVHKETARMRLDLLRVEVEALVRIVQLGGIDKLAGRDRKAAQFLADMTPEERTAFVAQSGTATTAAGMCRSKWVEEELAAEREASRRHGLHIATHPSAPTSPTPSLNETAAILGDVVDALTEAGEPFTVEEVAEQLIHHASIGESALDPVVNQGVREVCRDAIRRQPVVQFEDTVLPRTITAQLEDGTYVRIPVENALLEHLDQMREQRREQLAQDQAALNRLDVVAARLRSIPGASDTARIGDLIALTLMSSPAGEAGAA